MAHNRLVIFMSTVSDSIKDPETNPRFWDGLFNNVLDSNGEPTKRQIDGYIVDENEECILPKRLCHVESYLLYLCRGETNPSATVQTILDSSYELKASEYQAMKIDPNSEWYIEPVAGQL